MNTHGTTTQILSPDEATSIARRAAQAAKRLVMVMVPIEARGPANVVFDVEDLRRYTARELIDMLTGKTDLPEGK